MIIKYYVTAICATFIVFGVGFLSNLTALKESHRPIYIRDIYTNSSEDRWHYLLRELRSELFGESIKGNSTSDIPNKGERSWSRVRFYAAVNDIHHRDPGIDKYHVDNKTTDRDSCSVRGSVPRLLDDEQPPYVMCRRPEPAQGSCNVAQRLMHSKPPPSCSHQNFYTICQVQNTSSGYKVDCGNGVCKTEIYMGSIDRLTGAMKWMPFANVTSLENAISDVIDTDEDHGNFGFCFLKCITENATSASQLLLLPINMSNVACKNETVCGNATNINIIWLDSTSHSQFYRSMPHSVAAFRKLRRTQDAFVFNYNLMQSMRGGTIGNLFALTSGHYLSHRTLKRKKTPIGELFNIFKEQGYHLTWMDDLCWTWTMDNCVCGIPRFLGVAGDKNETNHPILWKQVRERLKSKGVDQTGVSLANCEILRENNISNPFKERLKHDAICYNGQFQMHYLLSSMEMMQKQLNSVKRPYFHFIEVNQGHEQSGRRIQTVDESLAKFIDFQSHQDDTVTLIFSDHGVKYGSFVKASKEAKVEMSHSVLFALVSRNLETKLGTDKMAALEVNQNRMVNMFDLRNTILTLAPGGNHFPEKEKLELDTHPDGLFHPISALRSCQSMGIVPEEFRCICTRGRVDNSVNNNTIVVLADFTLAQINKKIQKQFMTVNSNASTRYGSCHRLVGKKINAVEESIIDEIGLVITEMNIHVPGGSNSSEEEDIFSILIHRKPDNNSNSVIMELVHFERLTSYAVYDECRDIGVDGDICVCDLDTKESQIKKQWYQHFPSVFGQVTTVISLNMCLFVHERRSVHGLVLEASCDCSNQKFFLLLEINEQFNLATSRIPFELIKVDSRTPIFICAVYQLSYFKPWHLSYDVKYLEY